MFLFGVILTIVSITGLLLIHWRQLNRLEWIAKPLASLGFLIAAIGQGAFSSTYGTSIFVALIFSLLGDVFLIPKNKKAFLIGLFAFLLGHVGFAIAFLLRGMQMSVSLLAMALVLVPFVFVAKWLLPHVNGKMKGPVLLYMAVISVMVAWSLGTYAAHGNAWIPIAAVGFYLSDLSVARNQFVKPGLSNRLWGLPLYFISQLIFAYTIRSTP